jgi:hypothetical protein
LDAQSSPQILLCPSILAEGQQLAQSGYVGSLCGCWLQILLFIPQIFNLGQQWMAEDSPGTVADMVTTFALIQSQISSWEPSGSIFADVTLVGRIFREAMSLYLYTLLGGPHSDGCSIHATTIQAAVTKAVSYLEELQPTRQINTSLCWPIAIVGSCVIWPHQRNKIRNRLLAMAQAIGLGNIAKTSELLEYMWSEGAMGPWEIAKAMQASEIWISFA